MVLSIVLLVFAQAASLTESAILSRYIEAIGGEAALRAVKTRVTEGEFDNGRGLNTRYRIVEEAPNSRTTLIGTAAIGAPTGSGRGFDGTIGWDKSFIGTGLRTLEGRELADAARDADLLRPLHLFADCATTSVDSTPDAHVVACVTKAGGRVRYHFDKRTGILTTQDIEGAGARAAVHIAYKDYRTVDRLQLPFKTWIEVAGASIKYNAESIRHDQPIDREIFKRPASE